MEVTVAMLKGFVILLKRQKTHEPPVTVVGPRFEISTRDVSTEKQGY
jgi:hypothetical protein